ncbi:hypothetical protein RHS01_04302 [Rhizoctonia solani]|uniref:Uncharacterized protein n=1 Tax=Rhizoctonia solani TaxID=456999 RepID=A0A8H7M5H8_9AGAM|nr:hypothetical protein RHS01_04302 [Rhizoctonia solani]
MDSAVNQTSLNHHCHPLCVQVLAKRPPAIATKSIAQYGRRANGKEQVRRETFQRNQTISKKREAAAAGLAKAGRPRLSVVPEQPTLSSPPPRILQTPSKAAKGKGKLNNPPSLPAIAKGGRIMSPNQEPPVDEINWPPHPGPRPRPSGDVVLDGVELKEWNRQRLIFYLSYRDNKGSESRWDTRAVITAEDVEVDMSEFDTKPAPRKPVPVCSISPPRTAGPNVIKSPNARVRGSQSATNLFQSKRPAERKSEYEHANKRHQLDPKAPSMSTSIVRRDPFQPQPAARDSGQGLPPLENSSSQPHARGTNYTDGTSSRSRPFEPPLPSAGTSANPTGSRSAIQGSGRAPAEPSFVDRPPAPARALPRAPSEAPAYSRGLLKLPFTIGPPPRSSLVLRTLELAHNLYPNRGHHPALLRLVVITGSPAHSCSLILKRPPARRAPPQAPALSRTQDTSQHPQAGSFGGGFDHIPLTRAERELLTRTLEASRARSSVSSSSEQRSSSSTGRSSGHQKQAQRRSASQTSGKNKGQKVRSTLERASGEDEMDRADEFSDTDERGDVGSKMNDRLVSWRTHAANFMRDKAAAEYFPKDNPMTPNQLEAHVKQLKAGGLHTKLQLVVEEREMGKIGKSDLQFKTQRKAYNTHLTSHAIWIKRAGLRWGLIQDQLFLRGFKFSGASESALPVETKNLLRAEDIQPDDPDADELAAWEEEVAELTSNERKNPRGWAGLEDKGASGEEPLSGDNDGVALMAGFGDRYGREDRLDSSQDQAFHNTRERNQTQGGWRQRYDYNDDRHQHTERRQDNSYTREPNGPLDHRAHDKGRGAENRPRDSRNYDRHVDKTRARHNEDEDEYAHLNKIDNHEPDIYRDFGIEKASGSDFGEDYDEKGSPRCTPRRVSKTPSAMTIIVIRREGNSKWVCM